MIEHIPQLIDANISSLKIEGRMKGINYLASVVKTYRNAIDAYISSVSNHEVDTYEMNQDWVDELYQVFHREYCTGFYFGKSNEQSSNFKNRHQGEIHSFVGKIIRQTKDQGFLVEIRNKLTKDDCIEIISPIGRSKKSRILKLLDSDKKPVDAVHPNTLALLYLEIQCHPNDIIRKL